MKFPQHAKFDKYVWSISFWTQRQFEIDAAQVQSVCPPYSDKAAWALIEAAGDSFARRGVGHEMAAVAAYTLVVSANSHMRPI